MRDPGLDPATPCSIRRLNFRKPWGTTVTRLRRALTLALRAASCLPLTANAQADKGHHPRVGGATSTSSIRTPAPSCRADSGRGLQSSRCSVCVTPGQFARAHPGRREHRGGARSSRNARSCWNRTNLVSATPVPTAQAPGSAWTASRTMQLLWWLTTSGRARQPGCVPRGPAEGLKPAFRGLRDQAGHVQRLGGAPLVPGERHNINGARCKASAYGTKPRQAVHAYCQVTIVQPLRYRVAKRGRLNTWLDAVGDPPGGLTGRF